MGYTMLLLFVFLNLTLGGSNVNTIRYIFSSIFKAKKIAVYCMGNTFSEWYATYKHTERHMRQRRLKLSYFHVQYSCRDALSVRAFSVLRVGDYLYLRVTRESLANFAQSCAIISQTRKTICQTRDENQICSIYTI